MNKIVILVIACLLAASEGFCPYGCGCDEENSIVTCIKAKLEVIQFLKFFFQNFRRFLDNFTEFSSMALKPINIRWI